MFRCRELTRFLMRISTHPKLALDEHFRFFLSADSDQMSKRREEVEQTEEQKASGGGSWFSSFRKRANDARLVVVGSDEDDNPYFKNIEETLGARNALLSMMLQNSLAVVRQWRALSEEYQRQAELIRSFSQTAKDTDEKVSVMFNEDASACDQTVKLADEFATRLEHSYHDSIRDYLRENDAIQAVIDERMRLVRNYNALNKEAQKKSVSLEKRDSALAELDAFSKEAQTDIERVMLLRQGEIDYLTSAIARYHRSVYKQLVEFWALTCASIRE